MPINNKVQTFKALSLWQPWATLCAIGAKEYETRSWGTRYRGPLVIHAAKVSEHADLLDDAIYRIKTDPPLVGSFHHYTIKALYDFYECDPGTLIPYPELGYALCVVDLVDCVKMTPELIRSLPERERVFGRWELDRYAWKLANIRRFALPVQMRGSQGLFDCEIPEVEYAHQ